jgi:hypothetical protein
MLRSVAHDGTHVEPVLELAQHVGVTVDDRNFVGLFAGEAESGGAADLPCTQDENFHVRSLRKRGGATGAIVAAVYISSRFA